MSESNSPTPQRFDFETERKKLAAAQAPDPTDGVTWDKPAPTESPAHPPKQFPKHLEKIVAFFNGIVLDESLVLELCFQRVTEMVQENVERKTFGISSFAEVSPGQHAAIASPMVVELYKQVLTSITDRKEEYGKLLQEATRARERAATPEPSRIFIPGQ